MINDKNLIIQTTWQSLLLAVLYYAAGQLSFMLSVSNQIVSMSVFTAEGFSLAAMILCGARLWPGVFLGQIALAIANGLTVDVAISIALINSFEAILAAKLFRYFKLDPQLTRLRSIFGLFALVFLVLQPLSALLGNLVLWLNGIVPIEDLGHTLFAWWLSNIVGQVIITPLLVHLFYVQKSWKLALNSLAITVIVLIFGQMVLGYYNASLNPSADTIAFAESLVLVVIIGVFFDQVMVSLTIALLAFMVLFFSHHLTGAFVHDQRVMLMDLNAYLLGIVGIGQLLTPLLRTLKSQQQQQERLYLQLQKIAPRVPGVIFIYQADLNTYGRFLFISESVAELFQVSAEQVLKNASSLFHVLSHQDQFRLLNTFKDTSSVQIKAFEMECQIHHANGSCSWLLVNAKPEQEADGSVLWYGYFANISKYVIAKNLATQHEEALESILQSALGISIIATDLHGIITLFNRGAEKMLGYCATEMIGKKTPESLHSPEEIAKRCHELSKQLDRPVKGFNGFIAEITELGQQATREWTYICKDETQLIVQLTVSAIRNSALEITGYLGIAEDITQRKRDEIERSGLLQILTESHDFIGIGDMQARVTYLNKAARQMIGLALDADLDALKISALHTPEDYQRISTEVFPTLFDKGYWQGENQLLNQVDGHLIPVSQLAIMHCDAHGVPQQISSIMRDISEHKQIELSLQQAKQNAENLANAKTDFLAQMSHEIRTPMNAVIGLSQLALNKNITPEVRDYLQKIYHASTNLLGILNDILDFSKLEASGMKIESQPFDLNALLENLQGLFSERALEKGLVFSIDRGDDVPQGLIGDELRLQQILVNLLGNAIKFTERGKVSLSVYLDSLNNSEAYLTFNVKDSGIGISPENLNLLFQPFTQVDQSSSRRFSGTGLGLVISQKLLKLMGSEFQVKSALNQGSQFGFSVLLGVCTLESVKAAKPSPMDAIKNLQHLDGLRILVAEDNAINQQIVKEFLKLSGIHVELADNGQSALDRLTEAHYDVVLMDIHMPVLDGYQATRRIREQPQWTDLPVIALTAGVTEDEQEKCRAVGMNDVVAKPINPEKLIGTIKKWLNNMPRVELPTDASVNEPTPYGPMGPHIARFESADLLIGFDLTNLLVMLDNDWQAAQVILKAFAQDISNTFESIAEACHTQDLSAAMALTHQLRGAAGNVGAVFLYERADELETQLKQQQNYSAALAALKSAVAEVMQTIAQL